MKIAFVGDSLTAGIPGSSYLAVLRKRLPEHELANLGRGNDTVVSLYRRLARRAWAEPFDMAFLWIGVNDVAASNSARLKVLTALMRRSPARDLDEFKNCYRATLELLCRHARRIVAVPPLFKGEEPHSALNRELGILADAITGLVACCAQAEVLDLRAVFMSQLVAQPSSATQPPSATQPTTGYLSKSLVRIALDMLLLRSNARIDRVAAQRGLQFTLDGVHLNSVGARLVAERFAQRIEAEGQAQRL